MMSLEQAIEKLNDIRCHVKETSTEEQALVMAIDALKAQLSCEGTTSDLISRQAARHALCKAVHKGEDIPCENQTASCLWTGTRVCDYVREIDALPSVHPVATDTNVGDTISRQAAIDALKHNQDVYSHNFCDDPIDKYTTAIIATDIDTLVKLPSIQPEPKWIPCSERMPEPRIDVWVNSDLGQMVGYYDETTELWYGRNYLELIVNAWMPLPESYNPNNK